MLEKIKENKRNLLLVAVIMVIMAIGAASAYFTDTDSKVNSFTVGNVSVTLEEPNWKPDNGQNITPNKEIAKDPQVKNDGANEAFVFMTVKVPAAKVATANADGSLNTAAFHDLFTYTVSSDWVEVEKVAGADSTTYTYAYVGADKNMMALKPNTTTSALFKSVTFINAVEGQLDNKELSIDINVMGIQTNDLKTVKPSEVFTIVKNAK